MQRRLCKKSFAWGTFFSGVPLREPYLFSMTPHLSSRGSFPPPRNGLPILSPRVESSPPDTCAYSPKAQAVKRVLTIARVALFWKRMPVHKIFIRANISWRCGSYPTSECNVQRSRRYPMKSLDGFSWAVALRCDGGDFFLRIMYNTT